MDGFKGRRRPLKEGKEKCSAADLSWDEICKYSSNTVLQ